MRLFVGVLLFVIIMLVMHDKANSEAVLHCQPVLEPPPPNCTVQLGLPFTKRPVDCRRT